MLALVAVSLANTDGRSGSFLSRLLDLRTDRLTVVVVAASSFIANALFAALAGTALNRMVGQGIVALLVAFALFTAAIALMWRGRLTLTADGVFDATPAMLASRMLLAQFGDRSHFLIGALAATSGAGLWAAAGGLVGWILALLPFLAFGPALAAGLPARIVRLFSAAILALWGIIAAMGAFGLIGVAA